ncbi:MAG: PBSX family phage terminase large subunit [Methanobacterium sp.]
METAVVTNRLRISIPPVFKELTEPHRYKSYHGGRGSGKSYSFARVLLAMAATKKLSILCCREFQTSIADSVHRLLSDQINVLGLSDFYTVQKTEIFSTCGSSFIFRGLNRNIQEVKSLYGTDIAWIEESQSVSDESFEVLIPTIRKDDSEIWLSWNTGEITDPVYRRFVTSPPPDCVSKLVNYDVNPYFPEVLYKEMEYCKEVDHDAYEHIWLGKPWFASDALVFKDKFVVEDFQTPAYGVNFLFGSDLGFALDPTTLVRSFVLDNDLYIDYDAGGVGIEIDQTGNLYDKVPLSRDHVIKVDNSRPETISYLRRQGWGTVPCVKGQDSVKDGVAYLKSFRKIHIHSRCTGTANEFRHYSWKKDKLGNILPVLNDSQNHYIDALRYSHDSLIRGEVDWIKVVNG